MHVVEALGTGKIAVKREVAGDLAFANPIHELSEQDAVIYKSFAGGFRLLTLLETKKLQRIVLAARANVVGEQVVMGDLVRWWQSTERSGPLS